MSEQDGKDEVRYYWVDEDGERVSTRHKTLGTALSYVEGWAKREARLNTHYDEIIAKQSDSTNQHEWSIKQCQYDLETIGRSRLSLTLTGKRPVKLIRLVTRAFVEQPTMAEMKIAIDTVRAEFGEIS